MMSPPDTASQAQVVVAADPYLPESKCGTWGFFRTWVVRTFLKNIQDKIFAPGLFQSDVGSMWSAEGAKLFKLAQEEAPADQALGDTYLSRLAYKAQLHGLSQTRLTWVELRRAEAHIFQVFLAFGTPGALLALAFLFIRCWTLLIGRKIDRKVKAVFKQTQREERILRPFLKGREPAKDEASL